VTRRCGTLAGSTLLTVALVVGWAATVRAHNTRVDLALWGNFGPDAAHCQQIISRATMRCVQQVVAIRQACMDRRLGGDTCDSADMDGRMQAARDHAIAMVQQGCTDPELQNLRYLGLNDVTTDINNVCRQLDTAAASAAYGPAIVGGSVGAVDGSTQACIDAAARASARLLRFAGRARQQALDRMAATNMGPSAKLAAIARTDKSIAHARAVLKRRVEAVCPAATFQSIYQRDTDTFLGGIAQQADCQVGGVYVQANVVCPAPVCGNGIQESGEACDDGNGFDGDGCTHDCRAVTCQVFPTTYDLIQRSIFENHGCAEQACHGAARSGGLDLRADASYDNLIDVPSGTVPGWTRVTPGSKDASLLWINLAAATIPDQYHAPLRAMPVGLPPLSTDEIEALRLWIDAGASRTASVPGTATLLNACLPEPKPVEIKPLPPPTPGEGVQLHMPAWTLPPESEAEVCFSTYYDLTGQVPAEMLSEDGTRFRYKTIDIRQDPLSHHLIVDVYRGPEAANDPVWGTYTCKGGPTSGQVCDPLSLGVCGTGGECATDPDPRATACIGFGPQTSLSTLTSGGFAFAQATAGEFRFPAGVYNELPLKGVLLWNSHAFNLTHQQGSMEAWVNIYFPAVAEQVHKEEQIFNTNKIFWNDNFPPFPLPQLAPFQDFEVCHIHVFGRQNEKFFGSPVSADQTVHLFELSGHMHRRGKRFRIFRGSFTCKGGTQAGAACSPFNPEMCPGGTCTEDSGRDPQASLLYTNFIYNDPVVVRFDQPLLISGSASKADRSLTYCAHYDNGTAPNIENVKRLSTSPPAGTIFSIPIGGPCLPNKTRCIGGPHHNELCNGQYASCDSSPGAGDGVCDACPLTGGFRTEDEMFILFGNYWLE